VTVHPAFGPPTPGTQRFAGEIRAAERRSPRAPRGITPTRLHHFTLARGGVAALRWRVRRSPEAVRAVLLRGVFVEAAPAAPTVHAYCSDEARVLLSARGFACGPYDARPAAVRWLSGGRFIGRAGEAYACLGELDGTDPRRGTSAAVTTRDGR